MTKVTTMTGADVVRLTIADVAGERSLVARAAEAAQLVSWGFEGTIEQGTGSVELYGPLSPRNAAAARAAVPMLRPQPIGLRTSAGTGDRLGVATAGHVRAFQSAGKRLVPVFAQQSIREMDRLGRTPQEVLDAATFGCIEAGWQGPVGADADHLKTTQDIDRCLAAGYSLFTIDVGDFVTNSAGVPSDDALAALPWAELEDDLAAARRRYRELRVPGPDGDIIVSETDLAHAMAKYGRAVAVGTQLYRHVVDRADHPIEVEIAVDETDEPTTPAEHLYIATELHRLGARWVSFAPRHFGSFEKGVEFVGDLPRLFASIRRHAAIAQALGPYKIGMHSGSDKFSIYEGLTEATSGLVHLKTSGTSYLVALGVVAAKDPSLFRACYARSSEAYRSARASYQVSATTSSAPDPDAVRDVDLEALLHEPATRQILHVGYGAVLRDPEGGPSATGTAVRQLLADSRGDYYEAVADHIARHLRPYVRPL